MARAKHAEAHWGGINATGHCVSGIDIVPYMLGFSSSGSYPPLPVFGSGSIDHANVQLQVLVKSGPIRTAGHTQVIYDVARGFSLLSAYLSSSGLHSVEDCGAGSPGCHTAFTWTHSQLGLTIRDSIIAEDMPACPDECIVMHEIRFPTSIVAGGTAAGTVIAKAFFDGIGYGEHLQFGSSTYRTIPDVIFEDLVALGPVQYTGSLPPSEVRIPIELTVAFASALDPLGGDSYLDAAHTIGLVVTSSAPAVRFRSESGQLDFLLGHSPQQVTEPLSMLLVAIGAALMGFIGRTKTPRRSRSINQPLATLLAAFADLLSRVA